MVIAVADVALAFAVVLKPVAFFCARFVDRVKTLTGNFFCFSAFLLDELLASEFCSHVVVVAFSVVALLAALSPCVDTLDGNKAPLHSFASL